MKNESSHSKTRLFPLIVLVGALFGLSACGGSSESERNSNTATTAETTEATTSAPQAFDELDIKEPLTLRMEQTVNVRLSAHDPSGAPVIGARLNVCDVENPVVETSDCLASGFTNDEGEWHTQINVANHIAELKVVSNFIGLPHTIILPIENGELQYGYLLGMGNPQALVPPMNQTDFNFDAAITRSGSSTPSSLFNHSATYNSLGVPDNLEATDETITADLLYDINTSLPEHTPVFVSNPHYLEAGVISNIVLTKAADVCVTYIHEAAWFENALGYYAYDQSNPPQSPEDLTYHMVFPNLSDWALSPGNQVCLGNFPANTVIGWFLAADAWQYNGSDTIGDGYHIVHTNKELNPEVWDDLKHHTVLLHDPYRDRLILGLEDLRRDNQGALWNDYPWASDHDFNDAIFSVTCTPSTAVDTSNLKKLKSATLDRDADGVPDSSDAYPDDPDKAFDNFSPSPTTWASLAFEDQWPSNGDYDFNDVVVDYRFTYVTNAEGKVAAIEGNFKVKAVGAYATNGFGFELGVTPDQVESVTGSQLSNGTVTLANNGVEANQDKAVVIVFDDAHNVFGYDNPVWINTQPDGLYLEPVTLTVNVELTTPVSLDTVGLPPYNPFIFVYGTRSREVHLMGYTPTSLADPSYMNTADDNSQVVTYTNTQGLPWAWHFPTEFHYPTEYVRIDEAHLKVLDWALSGGTQYTDWYLGLDGYRNWANIYLTYQPN